MIAPEAWYYLPASSGGAGSPVDQPDGTGDAVGEAALSDTAGLTADAAGG
ncbi:MAG TPA: hypothetical protein VIN63_03580 [Candidatus Limnocylindria bacterium]|jgi:hypothetical protein